LQKTGDVIISYEDKETKSYLDLLKIYQGNYWKGNKKLLVFRNQKEIDIKFETK